MTDDQKTKIDPINPPQGMTGRQVAAWLRRGQRVFAKNEAAKQVDIQKAERAALMAERAQLAEQRRQARIAAMHANASNAPAINVTTGKVASFLWMPQFNLSFRGFGFAIGILVQIFARILISVGLIAPDHPARTPSGAQGFGLFKLLEEARLNLLPLRALQEKPEPIGQFAGIRALAVRQYTVFAAVVGVLVTGFLSAVIEISRIIFGSAYAYAQSAATPATSGIGVGGCPAITNTGTTTDYASACLDGIFGTGSSSTASVVSSGLGTMLQLYSNMMLVFAGIIVLWIMISAVAETARTGVPFGKNFNSVWAPIRLIVALGLLVPLGSGLNSGQYIVVSLAKWGSSQGTAVWNAYATKMITATTNSAGTKTLVLPSVSLDNTKMNQLARGLFQIALCEAVQNQTCTDGGGQSCNVQAVTITNPLTSPQAVSVVSSASGTTAATQATTQLKGVGWFVPDSTGQAPLSGYPNCGSVVVNLPTTASTNTSTTTNNGQAAMTAAAQSAQTTYLNQQNTAAAALETSLQSVANRVQSTAQEMMTNGATAPDPSTTASILQDYQSAVSSYITTQQATLKSVLGSYNANVASSAAQTAQQTGWIYAPVWLMQIVNTNTFVTDATQFIETPSTPQVSANGAEFTGGGDQGTAANGSGITPQQEWPLVNQIFNSSIPVNVSLVPSAQATNQQNIRAQLQQLTSDASVNPLAMAGTVGHNLLLNGFIAIEPPDVVNCFNNPSSVTGDCEKINTFVNNQTGNKAGNSSGMTALPPIAKDNYFVKTDKEIRPVLYGIGMIMISMGFMLIMLTFIPLMRFILGVLNWIMLIFEAVLAVPLISLSLLSTGGEGFSTQQFTANMYLIMGVILRPILMAIGMVVGLVSFNTIMQVTNQIFAPAVMAETAPSDNSLLTLGIYVAIYATLSYTLANSAFKMIDLMPNWVMSWIGARMESRVDDASAIQQQAGQFVQTLAYSNRADQADLGRKKEHVQAQQEAFTQAENASKVAKGTVDKSILASAIKKANRDHDFT